MKEIAIKENHLYNKAYSRGKHFVGKYVAVYVLRDYAAKRLMKANPSRKYINRLGLTVSKRVGGAVCRNRTKRIIRAAYRVYSDELYTGYLIVISARTSIVGKKSTDVEEDLLHAFKKLDMIKVEKTKTEE